MSLPKFTPHMISKQPDQTAYLLNKLVQEGVGGTGGGGGDIHLYPGTGQHTDGAMTQKATTNALGLKADSSTVSAQLANKVDKEAGKGLSSNDFTDGDQTKLNGIEAGAEVNVQADWTQTNTSDDDYIKNKPTLATVATSGDYDDLLNKPVIPAGAVLYSTTGQNTDGALTQKASTDLLVHAKPDGTNDLISNNKITLGYLPDSVLGQVVYGGGFIPSTGVATLTTNAQEKLGTSLATITLTNDTTAITGYEANEGIYYIATADGTFASIAFVTGDWLISTGNAWAKVDNTDAVTGVKGNSESTYRLGNVNLTSANIGAIEDTTSSVKTTNINDSAVTTGKINDSAVTTAKIADSNVTTNKINDKAVTTAKIDDSAVTTAKIDAAAVTTAKIADSNVTSAKIDWSTVTSTDYTITNFPNHSIGTNYYALYAKAGVATLFVDAIWMEPLAANTWKTIGTIPSAVAPKTVSTLSANGSKVYGTCVCFDGGGTVNAFGRVVIENNEIKIKLNATEQWEFAACFNLTWMVN